MAQKNNKKKRHDGEVQEPAAAAQQEPEAGSSPKLKRKAYEREMRVLHGELLAMQE
jgi:hypothetical protein